MASANNLGTAYIRIAPQMQGIQSSIQSKLSGLGAKTGEDFSKGFTTKWGAAAGAIAGITHTVVTKAIDALTNSIDGAIERVDTLNVFPKIMKNLGFETEESETALGKLSDRIEGLPTTLDEIVSYTQRLASTMGNLNKGTRNATNLALAFNDAALAGGKGQAEANRAFEQFVQVMSRGRPSMQDWKIMLEVMPGQLKQLAKYMGTNNKSFADYAKTVGKTVEQLDGMDLYEWISEDKNEHAKQRLGELADAMIALDTKGGAGITAFKDQVGDATHTIGTAMRLIPVRITKALAQVIQAFGAGDIYEVIDKFTQSFKKAGDWIVKYIVPPLKDDILPAISAVIKAIKNAVQSMLSTENGKRAAILLLEAFLAYKAISPVLSVANAAVKAFSAASLASAAATASLTIALTGIIVSVQTLIEEYKTLNASVEGANFRAKEYAKTLVAQENAQRQLTKAEALEQDLLDDIATKKELQNNAEYQALQAKQNLARLQNEYNKMLQEGTHSEDELRMKQLEVTAASMAKTNAEKQYKDAVEATKKAIEQEADANLTALHLHNQKQGALLLEKRDYATLAKQLDDLTRNTIEYTDAEGNHIKMSKERMSEISNWYAESLSKNDETWKAIVTKAQQEGISFVEAARKYGDEAGKALPGNFSKAIETYKPMALQQTQSMVDEIKGKFKSIDLSDVGKNIVSGLVNGMTSLASKVQSTSKSLADKAKTIMQELKMHSPSRVMFDVGRNIDLGLINGMESLAGDVEDTAKGIAEGIKAPFDSQDNLAATVNTARNVSPLSSQFSQGSQPQVVQNNTFNQVADDLDVKEASKLLGFEVATAI